MEPSECQTGPTTDSFGKQSNIDALAESSPGHFDHVTTTHALLYATYEYTRHLSTLSSTTEPWERNKPRLDM